MKLQSKTRLQDRDSSCMRQYKKRITKGILLAKMCKRQMNVKKGPALGRLHVQDLV